MRPRARQSRRAERRTLLRPRAPGKPGLCCCTILCYFASRARHGIRSPQTCHTLCRCRRQHQALRDAGRCGGAADHRPLPRDHEDGVRGARRSHRQDDRRRGDGGISTARQCRVCGDRHAGADFVAAHEQGRAAGHPRGLPLWPDHRRQRRRLRRFGQRRRAPVVAGQGRADARVGRDGRHSFARRCVRAPATTIRTRCAASRPTSARSS